MKIGARRDTLADLLDALADEVSAEADVASRYGQADRLLQIAERMRELGREYA